jgi:hypothetical protein
MIWLWRLSGLLDPFRDRGMEDSIQRSIVKKTFEADNLEKLNCLIAKFKADIQAHDAKVAAAQAALAAREFMDHIDHMDESFASLPSCSTEMTSSCATPGNTEGSCTITISHTQRKELRHHKKNKSTSVLAAARAINARTGRPPSETVRCMLTEFRLLAFETGRQYMQKGTVDFIKLSTVIQDFKKLHPNSPPLKSTITVDDWKKAVRANNIDMITMAQSGPEVKTVYTVEEKLKLRPDMKYLIDWCIRWIKSDRAAEGLQSFKRMEEECNRVKETGDPFFVKQKGVSYGKDALSRGWQQLLDYEKQVCSGLYHGGGRGTRR